MNLPETALD